VGESVTEWHRLRGTPLTARELEVLTVLASGSTMGKAAEQLHLSRNTIKSHLRRIGGKLGTSGGVVPILVEVSRRRDRRLAGVLREGIATGDATAAANRVLHILCPADNER
jgi:DNA-binding NarL/FixJ family response regulator